MLLGKDHFTQLLKLIVSLNLSGEWGVLLILIIFMAALMAPVKTDSRQRWM